MKLLIRFVTIILAVAIINGCTGVPNGMKPVDDFDLDKYLGTWYEIARLDHPFEKGLEQVTAHYQLRDDGGISVINKGYSTITESWETAEGKAYFVDDEKIGHLKVSFFGPFYASYVIYSLDQENYEYAFVTGYNQNYMWLLSRTPTIEDSIMDDFLHQAKGYGFNTNELILVRQQETSLH